MEMRRNNLLYGYRNYQEQKRGSNLQEQMQNLIAEQTQALRSGKFEEYI